MPSILLAIEAANALLALITNASTAISQINSTISAAQSAGRDLTDDEVNAAIVARKMAEVALAATLGSP